MPAEDPIHLGEVTDLDEDLTEYGHHSPKHPEADGAAPKHAADAEPSPSADRRPAYSETV
jgi:aerobic C4-dicarboxylate transport protein